MPPASARIGIMNNDVDDAVAGAQHMRYGQQQQQPKPQDERRASFNVRHIPGASSIPYSGGILMNTNNANGGTGRREDGEHHARPSLQSNTPLFERLVTEEVQELKAYARIIESQNRRLAELERVHGDLETRLEKESISKQLLETTLEERERLWHQKYTTLQKDRDHWKEVVQIEQNKNSRLIEQILRKDQDIQKMLQRKYDQPREGHFNQGTVRSIRPGVAGSERERAHNPSAATARSPSVEQHKSPHEILAANGSAEAVRVRNVAHTLLDFFNMR